MQIVRDAVSAGARVQAEEEAAEKASAQQPAQARPRKWASGVVRDMPEYKVWATMIRRCHDPKEPHFEHYGARGIRVCDRWRASFDDFFEDLGPRPSGLGKGGRSAWSLDRKNNALGYEPGNVRWATDAEQQRNRSTNRLLTYRGVTQTMTDWGLALGIKPPTIWARLARGWTTERALEAPLGRWANRCAAEQPEGLVS